MLVGLCLYFFFLQSFLSSYAGSWLDGVFFDMLVCLCLAFSPLHVCLPFVSGAFPSYLPDRLVFLFSIDHIRDGVFSFLCHPFLLICEALSVF